MLKHVNQNVFASQLTFFLTSKRPKMAYKELSKPIQNQNFNFNGLELILVVVRLCVCMILNDTKE